MTITHLLTRILSVLSLSLLLITTQSCQLDGDTPGTLGQGLNNTNPYGIKVAKIEKMSRGETTTVTDNVSKGLLIDDLSWAANSTVACFPGTRAIEFQGKQVFYEVEIPQGTELIVTVTPTGEVPKRINVYGYINFTNNVPPVQSVVSCEAGYPIYAGTPDLSDPGETRKIGFAQAVNKSFTALIVVSGAQGVHEGEYELTFTLE